MIKINAYNDKTKLSEDEIKVYNAIVSISHCYFQEHRDKGKIPYISTDKMMDDNHIYLLSNLNKEKYGKAIYHLRICGIIEKILLYKSKLFYYRVYAKNESI